MTGLQDAVVRVIDDDASMRAALADLLASIGHIVRSYETVDDYLAANDDGAPGCLVLDVRMPGRSGLDFQQNMADLNVDLPVIFISGHADVAMTARAMKAGAVDFFAKPFDEQALLDAIDLAIRRDRERITTSRRLTQLQDRFDSLNDGERDVMRLVVDGITNKDIAARLGVSEITVKVRRGNVMRKMGAETLPDLVRLADKLGTV